MNKENTQKLWEKYPLIFADKNASIQTSMIPFGFECGDGWYWIINQLCDSIQGYIDANKKPQVVASQVKEKFGGLRFYAHGGDDIVFGMIWLAESMSMATCEQCGTTVNVTHGGKGWIYTECDKCRVERLNRSNDTIPPLEEKVS